MSTIVFISLNYGYSRPIGKCSAVKVAKFVTLSIFTKRLGKYIAVSRSRSLWRHDDYSVLSRSASVSIRFAYTAGLCSYQTVSATFLYGRDP